MKNAKKILFALLACAAFSAGTFAQDIPTDPKYGATPEERQQNILSMNLFKDAYDMKNYDVALQHMHTLLKNAPKSTVNIYVRGANIYKGKIMQATDLATKKLYVDSLMYIYDQRVEHFGDSPTQGRAYILTMKANDYLNFNRMDQENVLKYIDEAIEATEGKDVTLINTYFKVLVDDYASDLVETDVLMNEFERLSGLLSAGTDPAQVEGLKMLEQMLVASGAADCGKLEEVYRPQYEADPNNVELMKKIVNMMGRAECSSDFMLTVTENLYKAAPEPQTGVFLAAIFEQKGDFEKSFFYWQESINNETDPTVKKDYILSAAVSALAGNNYRQAVTLAPELLDIDPENGMAYRIIGQSYGAGASSACGDAFQRGAVLWLAVDNLQKARSLLSGDQAQVDTINSSINSFSGSFPDQEQVFFLNLNPGDGYTVNCGWISGRTTVR